MAGPSQRLLGGESGPQTVSLEEFASTVGMLRRALDGIDAGELTCSADYRNRLNGDLAALEALAGMSVASDTPGSAE